ncbi:MAG TPA: glycosyltransferase [Gaiellaceae bacterium]|nr:glycosyltransferase [Gaiellaceae bacterium]
MSNGPDGLTILVAARDEEDRIGATVAALKEDFPEAEVIVLDGRSGDRTAECAEAAGAAVLRLERLGKGEALSAGERAAPPGPLLLCDADLRGSLRPLLASGADLAVASFRRRSGGGFGIAKRLARELVRLRTGVAPREPLSGQRLVGVRARAACFPLAPGFGCEVRMTIDALRAGLRFEELELDLDHRATGRDVAGFAHRGRQLLDALLAAGPLALNHRGLRLPLVGWTTASQGDPGITLVMLLGFLDDAYGGEARGFRDHLRARRTTGVAKLVGIPLVGLLRTRSLSGALLFALAANALNQLDTRPGRCLKAYLLAALPLRAPLGLAVLLLPYDLRERAMLGDAGSNALGAMLGLKSVERLHGTGRWAAIGALAGLTVLGERTSLGRLIERTRGLRELDRLGRLP